MKKLFIAAAFASLATGASAQFVVEWDKIEHWAGEGPNRAALVVQFADNGPRECYVWGYRWADGEQPTGEDMVRAIATESDDLILFTQYTGWMGNTLCGLGFSDHNNVINYVTYDFDAAAEDENVSFDYFTPNTSLGQSSAPAYDTQTFCDEAIDMAKDTHIIEHPINAEVYGYAAYDYDWWQTGADRPEADRWQAGWYKGYWSYWTGGVDSNSLAYSGLGMSSVQLVNEDVNGWCYKHIDGETPDGVTGASYPTYPLNYSHFTSTQIQSLAGDNPGEGTVEVYSLNGNRLGNRIEGLSPGIYIIKLGTSARKIHIR